jgi:hypothetical protein
MGSQSIRRYPWEEWFSRDEFKLKQGKDFHCQLHGMIVQIRNYAGSKRIKVAIKTTGKDALIVTIKERNAKRNAG